MRERSLDEWLDQMIVWRRYLHQNPELSFHEVNTSRFIAEQLESFGLKVIKNVGGHGVIGILQTSVPGPVVMLRADMDALPIQDEKETAYKSQVDGAMHACGHDGHMATLLATAGYMSEHREDFIGEVRFLFQPAEELLPGGAAKVIADGALTDVDVIYGIHLWTPIPLGQYASTPGAMMAAADDFYIELTGKGGHGGMPHTSIDSIVAGASLVLQMQSVVSRSVDPLQPAVLTIGTIKGGSAQNVIAENFTISGTVRTFDEETRYVMKERVHRLTEQVSSAYGAAYNINYVMGYPPVVNDDKEAARFFDTATKAFGAERVRVTPKLMPAEDFAYYLQEIPGCFMFVGAGSDNTGAIYPHHHPKFDFDEQAMLDAMQLFIQMTKSYAEEYITSTVHA
ncbi:M20 family metallopeptidase [Paenibacillus sp. PDC88]|uniref:M20 metallopeptidase family protein n=1 Tax=Paenibacillus sp. PDC88 TaxID=1884375 RepID=UPI000896EFDE|nr:amidohydrolase [Paenibacillus sp. PDC88]SDX10399.1 amidohydrolase [Paenibacillus sp. PDC88]